MEPPSLLLHFCRISVTTPIRPSIAQLLRGWQLWKLPEHSPAPRRKGQWEPLFRGWPLIPPRCYFLLLKWWGFWLCYPEPCIERADSKAFNLLGSQLNWVQLKPPCITLTITKLQKKGFAAFCVSAVKISRVFVSLPAHPALADMTFHKERTENGPKFQCKNSTRSAITCRKSV